MAITIFNPIIKDLINQPTPNNNSNNNQIYNSLKDWVVDQTFRMIMIYKIPNSKIV